MKMASIEMLDELTKTQGVSGNEQPVSEIIGRYFRKYSDNVWRDKLGNLFCQIGKGKPVLMLMAHMDEIGMIVTGIETNGLLRLTSIGGVDARTLPGSEVIVYGEKEVKGVIGVAPDEKNADNPDYAFSITDMVCDVGLNIENVQKLISVGDFVTFDNRSPMILQDGFVTGKTIDDRSMILALVETLDILSKRKLNCSVVCVASVLEERGCLGARPATYNLAPDMAIAIDVCHAPMPGAGLGETVEPEKIAITTGANIHPGMFTQIKEAAIELNVPFSVDAWIAHSGTDAWNIQNQLGGIATGLISLPVRYMHTSVETFLVDTLHNIAKLLAEVAARIDTDWETKLCWND